MFSLKIRNKTRMSNLITSIQHFTGGAIQCSKVGKRNKRDPHWEGNSKTVFIHKT